MEKPFLGVDVVGIENILCHNGLHKLGSFPGTALNERPQDILQPSADGKPVSEGVETLFRVSFFGSQKSEKGSIDVFLAKLMTVMSHDIVPRVLMPDTCVEIESTIDFMRLKHLTGLVEGVGEPAKTVRINRHTNQALR